MSDRAFADAFNRALEHTGLSQSEIARRIDIQPSNVNEWTRGSSAPRLARLPELAGALDVVFVIDATGWTLARKRPMRGTP